MARAHFIDRADVGSADALTGNTNERRYALGALKALLALRLVEVSYYGEGTRASQWQWLASN
jgi:hypothetical protein